MSSVRLAVRQVGLENRAFWRNQAAAFFTVVLPIVFMVIATVAFSGPDGGPSPAFYTPAVICLGLITATYTSLAMGVVVARDLGILKRLRGTPLPTWAYLFGKIGQSVFVAALLVAFVVGHGGLAHGVLIPGDHVPALLATLGVGALSFSALGLAVSGFVPNAGAAPAVVNATILPLLLISDVLFPIRDATLTQVARLFPVRHLADAVRAAYDSAAPMQGFVPESLAFVAGWGVAGLILALLTFRWQPRG